jgi:hypothetical protein
MVDLSDSCHLTTHTRHNTVACFRCACGAPLKILRDGLGDNSFQLSNFSYHEAPYHRSSPDLEYQQGTVRLGAPTKPPALSRPTSKVNTSNHLSLTGTVG